ncbi:MAG: 4Fe-4S dicluster domain-containing protein [Planctomycetota bacterium]|nr:MAG: 4Fe-4S dicluster domain-containing protein [Planctomycetota bacterium]
MAQIYEQDKTRMRDTLDEVLERAYPPVAVCRLLSSGIEAYHRLNTGEVDVTGDQACIACGACIDACPVLRREQNRLELTDARTSFALETMVDEDCEKCFSCVLSCPQVGTYIKDVIVDEKLPETIRQNPKLKFLDAGYLSGIIWFIIGLIIGMVIML